MNPFFYRLLFQKEESNYLYFSFLFTFLALLSFSHFLISDLPLKGVFLFYATVQAFFEIICFVLIEHILKKFTSKPILFIFISFLFIGMVFHFVSFCLVRLMDVSIAHLFGFFLGSGPGHWIAGFQALNLNRTSTGIILALLLFLPTLGIGFYWFTFKLIRGRAVYLSLAQIGKAMGAAVFLLLALDLSLRGKMKFTDHERHEKMLPLASTFLAPLCDCIELHRPFPKAPEEGEFAFPLFSLKKEELPNIYLFVIETFRRDFLVCAPNLMAFHQKSTALSQTYANACSTALSWFSIFHARLPFHWSEMREYWTKGSIPLQMLKKMGYEISVFSSADLRFFSMDKLLFGEKRNLVGRVEEFIFQDNLETCERDLLCFEALEKKIEPTGQVYLFFLESPHSEYSFPKSFSLRYEPIAQEIDYIAMSAKYSGLEKVKNRYRNALAFVDDQLGRFFNFLKEKNLFDNAIIAVTGDHGEEFYEEGALFHSTHLNEYQTAVPICLKIPDETWTAKTKEMTHIDLFPSILHYLTKTSDFNGLFDGHSIFSERKGASRIAILQNGAKPPTDFYLEKGALKLKGRLVNRSKVQILDSQTGSNTDLTLLSKEGLY